MLFDRGTYFLLIDFQEWWVRLPLPGIYAPGASIPILSEYQILSELEIENNVY